MNGLTCLICSFFVVMCIEMGTGKKRSKKVYARMTWIETDRRFNIGYSFFRAPH